MAAYLLPSLFFVRLDLYIDTCYGWDMEGKPVSASYIIDQVVEVFPNDLNPHGTLFGGRVMEIIDNLAAIVAKSHSGAVCVTLGIDSVRFLNPARRGDILVCMASVNKAW